MGLHVHKVTRNKSLVDLLSNLNLSIPYNKVMKIETAIGNACIKDMKEHSGTFIPPNIVLGKPIHFAIDNTDFKNDTSDGTGHVVFQKLDENMEIANLVMERGGKNNMKLTDENILPLKTLNENLYLLMKAIQTLMA